jgi:endonuclease/exonuclease/phosphatase family metal-dependent hydrolase
MAASAEPAQEVSRLRLLQLNLFLRPPPIASLSGAECKDERAAHFCAQFLEGNDVVALQECFGFMTRRRARLVEAARARGFRGVAISRRAPLVQLRGGLQFRPIDGGLVLLSRFPFVTSEFRLFSAACDADRLAAKGVLYALVDLGRADGRKLHLLTTHTQASYNFAASAASLAVKEAQLRELGAFMLEVTRDKPKDWPLVLAGDFNMDSLQEYCPEYRFLVQELDALGRTMVDAVRAHNGGAVLATTTPFEWRAQDGIATRSSLMHVDREAYLATLRLSESTCARAEAEAEAEAELQAQARGGGGAGLLQDERKEALEKPQGAPAVGAVQGKPTNSASYARGSGVFWADQCLDYTWVDRDLLEIAGARVEPLAVQGQPYTQISDHHALVVELVMR